MTDRAELPLRLSSPREVVSRPSIAVLQEKATRPWQPPAMVVDLSRDRIHHSLFEQSVLPVHSTYVGRYYDQYVFGFHHLHAFLSQDGEFNCQEIENYTGRLDYHIAHLPPPHYAIPEFRKGLTGYTVSFSRLPADKIIHIDEPVFFGSPIEPANWGMWLLNGLLSAFSFVSGGHPGKYLCYAPERWQQGLLALAGIDLERVVQQAPWTTYHCREVAVHQYSHVDLVPDEMARSLFRNIVVRCCAGKTASTPERLFVSRRSITKKLGGKYRALLNEDELVAAFEAKGYSIVEPELLPFEEQVRLFANAKVVVGLGGAAMFNAVFCRPGTKIVSIESTNVFLLNHARLFAALDLNYGFILGQQDSSGEQYPHNPWTIDVAGALQAVLAFA
jgi:Glycosyltransferase 61